MSIFMQINCRQLCVGASYKSLEKAKHGPNNYKDTKPQMLSLLVFNRVYRLEIVSHVGIFDPLVKQHLSYLLTSSPPPSPSPPSCVNKYRVCIYTVCKRGEGDRVVWRAYTGVIHCAFELIPNLQIFFPPQTKT